MKNYHIGIVTLIVFGAVQAAPSPRLHPSLHGKDDIMRVLLQQRSRAMLEDKPFELLIKAPVTVKTQGLHITHEEHQLTISSTPDGHFYLHELGQTVEAPLSLIGEKDASVGLRAGPYKRYYKGAITIENGKNGKDAYIINHVPLEDYVYGVVIKEMSPTWHEQAHQAQAVAARTYALYLKSTLGHRRQYDIRASEKDQMYVGENPRWLHVKKEIEPVKHQVLVEDDHLSLAMFAACCGGVKPEHATEFNRDKNPYLARPYACTHCNGAAYGSTPLHRWQHQFDKQKLFELLRKHPDAKGLKPASHLHRISTTHHEPSGKIRTITLHCDTGEYTLPAKLLKSLGKSSVLSYYFTIAQDKNKVTLHGKGFGHPIGMCQYGTQAMALKGASSGQILRYYYPTARIVTL